MLALLKCGSFSVKLHYMKNSIKELLHTRVKRVSDSALAWI